MDIIVAGDLFVDLIMSGFSSWPQVGAEAFAKSLHREVGGGAAISACGLAKLGMKTSVLGVIGRDGEWIADRLTNFGVDVSHVCIDAIEPTAITVAISTEHERTFLTYRGANLRFLEVLAAFTGFAKARHVHLAW